MPDHGEHVAALFEAAMSLDPGKRSAFLDRACGDEGSLRQEVEELLNADAAAGSFLRHPVFELPIADDSHASQRTIGPYHLLELIGEGGMGEVWLAEQRQPVRRRVAIKLIKAGMDTREVVARFESERQALALMDHPAIAKVFEAGSTLEGRPYFAMEYVAGVPITAYCDRHKLTVRQRMELFIQVCEGVQHAHQKAIIHRDLKPSNILVTEVDGKPMPRIIDFGVAKATSQKLSAGTVYTRLGTLIGTLGYMSPEQADPTGEDIDIRTDVYSLGAVLYELFTGTLPLDFKKHAYDEVLRRLRNEDATRPSTKLATLGEESAIAAKNRSADPPTLVRQLRGDPDSIALKAIEKDRACRYASASELAADIGRYLRNENVTAHLPSVAYRTRKYLGRHRLGLAVAASAVLAIALLVTWSRIPAAVPVVESVVQLTDDGQPKGAMVTDGSRIYFSTGEIGRFRIAQVPVIGGSTIPVEARRVNSIPVAMAHDSPGLVFMAANSFVGFSPSGALWLLPLPAGEPRRLGNIETPKADVFPDGRIIFEAPIQGTDPNGTDNRTDWFIADQNGANLRKLISFPGLTGDVSVSPSGRRLLLSQEQPGNRRLFEVAGDGKNPLEILRLGEDECCFRWTDDEMYLVYQSGGDQRSDIWLLPMQSGPFRRERKPIRLTNGPLPYSYPCPSRDGKQIFVFGTKQRGELVHYDMQSHQFLPFLSGISATDPSFSRDGKWVAYVSYPDHVLWRSRSDGTDRMQLTYSPMDVRFPAISPDGKRASFHAANGGLYLIGMDGGTPEKIDDKGVSATWSPDGNYLYFQTSSSARGGALIDLRTGKKSAVPSSTQIWAFWLDQHTLIGASEELSKFITFSFKTGKWTDFAPGSLSEPIMDYQMSPDYKYFYFTTRGAEPKAMRYRVSDQRLDMIASLKGFHWAVNSGLTQINVAPDGSPVFTRDTGYQEIYALNIRWP
jgi:serine/threonine protein kinase/Tol biopolymer transport system component